MVKCPLVSVIIPVYNTAGYLKMAVSSIQKQTLTDIEIIIVNDGSTDNSIDIINELSEGDPRIKVHSQSNNGLSVTRNLGLGKASGEFVYFMDSDDILELDALSVCYKKCVSQDLDIVIFDADVFYDSGNTEKSGYNYIRSGKVEARVYEGREILEVLLDKNLFKASACLFFVKRELIEKLKLRFFPGIIHEDELFTPILYLGAKRVGYLPQIFFHRRIRGNSIMTNKFSDRNLKGYFTVIENLKVYKETCDLRGRLVVDRLIRNIVISISDQSGSFSVRKRYSIIASFLKCNLLRYARLRSFLILLSPFSNFAKEKVFKPIYKIIGTSFILIFI